MDTLYWIAVFSLTVLGPVFGQINIQLNVSPAGEIKQGDTITLTCSRDNIGTFDVLKILRKVDSIKHEVLVNAILDPDYEQTGRYKFLTDASDLGAGKIVLEITGITGADRGEYECADLASGTGAVETINVLVPPAGTHIEYKNDNTDYATASPIENFIFTSEMNAGLKFPPAGTHIEYKNDNSNFVTASPDENVIFTTEMNAGLKCVITVQGSLEMPEVTLKLGEEDVISRFKVDQTEVNKVNGFGLYETGRTYIYEENLDQPNKADHGKVFSCSSKMPNHDDVLSAAINVEVHYKPELTCATDMVKSKQGVETKLTCSATMNPKYTSAVWSWKEADSRVTLTADEGKTPDGNMHFMKSEEGDKYTFTLHILKVGENDFRNYKLSVDNGVGESQEDRIKLEEEETTTPKPVPTTTRKSNQNGENSDSVIDNGSGLNSASSLSTLLATTLTFIVILVHSL